MLLILIVTLSVYMQSPRGVAGADSDSDTSLLAASADPIVGSFRGRLNYDGKSVALANPVILKSENRQTSTTTTLTTATIKIKLQFKDHIELEANFSSSSSTFSDKNPEEFTAADQVLISWHSKERGFSRCRLDGARLFAAPKGKHYLCDITKVYPCRSEVSSSSSSLDAELVVDYFELGLNNGSSKTSGLETEAFLCT